MADRKSKYRNQGGNPSDVGRRNAALEKSRTKLMDAVIQYKELLDETTLLSNRTQLEKQAMGSLLSGINDLALELDTRSVGEGARVVASTALNALILIKDQVNQLQLHNYYLTKRVEKLEEEKGVPEDVEPDGEES